MCACLYVCGVAINLCVLLLVSVLCVCISFISFSYNLYVHVFLYVIAAFLCEIKYILQWVFYSTDALNVTQHLNPLNPELPTIRHYNPGLPSPQCNVTYHK